MYGQPGRRLSAGPGGGRMVAGRGPQVNAAGWVNLGVWGAFPRGGRTLRRRSGGILVRLRGAKKSPIRRFG
jgi:hypothetical protein